MNLNLGKNIKMIISDFDGVFTDGGLYVDSNGNLSKKVNFSDVMGIFLLLKSGRELAIISGDKAPVIDYLQKRFGIKEVYQDIRNKKEVVTDIMKRYNLKEDEIVYLGDDVNDIDSMQMFNYVVVPQNANFKVKELKHLQILEKNGGDGFFREVVDNIIY